MGKIIFGIIVIAISLGLTGCGKTTPYPQAVESWKSYKDVASYMQNNFKFSTNRQDEFKKDLGKYRKKNNGYMQDFTVVELSLKPIDTYNNGGGFCGDSAILIKDALNKVNPNYNAKIIFIWNDNGQPHHWVTGFYVEDQLYVMDYGAGPHWKEMMGTHGPYDSLNEYGDFLASINAKGFKFGSVRWRD